MPEGRDVVAPSAIPIQQEVMIENGMATPTPPRELTLDEIAELRADYAHASRNALEAGFDGIEIHAAGAVFLVDTFARNHE